MRLKAALVIFALFLGTISLRASLLTTENEMLSVTHDDFTTVFSVAQRVPAKTFLTQGRLEGVAAKATAEPATDTVFGRGRKITVTQSDGSTVTLALYIVKRWYSK